MEGSFEVNAVTDKREGVAAAVSNERRLMIHTNYIINSDWSKLSVYEHSLHFVECVCLHFDATVSDEV